MQALLIRHAQADWGGSRYDRLSDRGRRQAAQLGRWLAGSPDWRPQRLLCGPRRRHRDTVQAIRAAYRAAGIATPAVEVEPDWDDGDAEALLRAFRSTYPDAPELAYVAAGATAAQGRALLRVVFAAWRSGRLDADMPERWDAFAARVARARAALAAQPCAQVLVVSSAGAIARCAQAALRLDDAALVELNVRLANAALALFSIEENQWYLEAWNLQPLVCAGADAELASSH